MKNLITHKTYNYGYKFFKICGSLDELTEIRENCKVKYNNEKGIVISHIQETNTSFSFRVFKNGKTINLFMFNK